MLFRTRYGSTIGAQWWLGIAEHPKHCLARQLWRLATVMLTSSGCRTGVVGFGKAKVTQVITMTRLTISYQYGPLSTITNQYQPFFTIIKRYYSPLPTSINHSYETCLSTTSPPVCLHITGDLPYPGSISSLAGHLARRSACCALTCANIISAWHRLPGAAHNGGGNCYAGRKTGVLNGYDFKFYLSFWLFMQWNIYLNDLYSLHTAGLWIS